MTAGSHAEIRVPMRLATMEGSYGSHEYMPAAQTFPKKKSRNSSENLDILIDDGVPGTYIVYTPGCHRSIPDSAPETLETLKLQLLDYSSSSLCCSRC